MFISQVEEAVDGAEPPKRARCDDAAALPAAWSAKFCEVAVRAAHAWAFWPKIVAAGLADIDALQRNGADAALADIGLSLAQREAIREGLAGFQ